MANSKLTVSTSGRPSSAADFAPNAAIGNVLTCVAGATPAHPLEPLWVPPAGGTPSVNLSNVVFADRATTVPLADQTGNIEAPFALLQSAITAAAALPTPATVFVIASAVAYDDIVLPAGSQLTIAKLGVCEAGIAAAGTAGADGLLLNNVTTGGAGALLRIIGAQIATLICQDNTEQVLLDRCSVLAQTAGLVTNPQFQLYNSTWLGNMHHSGLMGSNSDISLGVVTADANGNSVSFGNGCVFSQLSLVDPGPVVTLIPCDMASQSAMQTNLIVGGPLTNYTLSAGWTRRSFKATVAVPAVLAGNVAYFNYANVLLAIMQEEQPIAVNPAVDLVAAGAGGGYINARMVNDAGTVKCRMAFLGPIAGGPADFVFTAV